MISTSPEPASGVAVVDKPAGLTSHDVVARVRRLAGTRKVGHAGTLDPMATGVLVLGVNKATRLVGHLMLGQKEYDATIRLGTATTTDDAEGDVVSRTPAGHVSDQAVRDAATGFVGEIEQVPASVSAVKVDGKRAYTKVRAGEAVQLAARRVRIDHLEVTGLRREDDLVDVDIAVRCSSGTYVRAIARDLGAALGVGGHLTMLRRTRVEPFELSEAQPLPEPGAGDRLRLLDLDDVGRRCFPSQRVDAEGARHVSFGRPLEVELGHPGPVAVVDGADRFLALYQQRGPVAVPLAVFAPAS